MNEEPIEEKYLLEKTLKTYSTLPEKYWEGKIKEEFPNLSVKPREGYTYENVHEDIKNWGIGQILTNNVKLSDVSNALLFSLVKPKPWYIVIITKSDISVVIAIASDIDIVYNNGKWEEFEYRNDKTAYGRGLVRYGYNYSQHDYGSVSPKLYNNSSQVMERLNQLIAQGYYIITRSLSELEYEELKSSGKVQRTFQRFIIKDMTEEEYNQLINTDKIVNSKSYYGFEVGHSLFYQYPISGKEADYIQFR